MYGYKTLLRSQPEQLEQYSTNKKVAILASTMERHSNSKAQYSILRTRKSKKKKDKLIKVQSKDYTTQHEKHGTKHHSMPKTSSAVIH